MFDRKEIALLIIIILTSVVTELLPNAIVISTLLPVVNSVVNDFFKLRLSFNLVN